MRTIGFGAEHAPLLRLRPEGFIPECGCGWVGMTCSGPYAASAHGANHERQSTA